LNRTKISDDRTDSYLRALDEFLNMDPRLIMCIVPNNRADRYSAIKKRTCVDRSVPTQVILTKTITPKQGGGGALMSVATKVVIQLNCKLGGAPWMVNMPISGLMTIGFDVCYVFLFNTKDFN
jgi:aubergine-like protein